MHCSTKSARLANSNEESIVTTMANSKDPISNQRCTPVRHLQRPTLRNLNPVFHKRAKSEDNAVVSDKLLANARRSGTLHLPSRGLSTVPDCIYNINEGDSKKKVTLESLSIKEDDAWWNEIPLTNLDLSSNQLIELSPKIEKLSSLTTLILFDNALTFIPKEIGKLEKLIRVNISRNKIKNLPREFFTLPNLRHLNLSYNEFEEINPDISDLHMLEFLDLSNNQLKALPGGIGFLVRIITLLVNYNHLKQLPNDLVNMRSLQKLDIMHNDLIELPQDIGSLRKLQCLYVQHNDIQELPDFDGCGDLQELHASNNFIKQIPQHFCLKLPHLKILDLRDNQIEEIPDEICFLQNLTRLDVSNNSLTNLPVTLSQLAHLISLQVDGNPIKTIRRDILQCGTVRILKTLRERAIGKETSLKNSNTLASLASGSGTNISMNSDGLNSPRRQSGSKDSIFPDKYQLRRRHSLLITNQNLTEVPDKVFVLAKDENIQIVDFSRNRLSALPDGLKEMKDVASEIIFANNLIAYVPAFMSQFTRVTLINLSCNNLSTLPTEFGFLSTLKELNISHNRFENIPNCLYELKNLEILLACDNCIKIIDASEKGFGALKRLATLDLRNNNITQVPPILGNLTNITMLNIIGNPFKLPRYQILEKGTEAIMSYLRDRIPI